MEDPSDEEEFLSSFSPHSQRELHSFQLLLLLVRIEAERNRLLRSARMAVGDFEELFDIDPAQIDPEHD